VTWRHAAEGQVLGVGRRTRAISPGLRRALVHRVGANLLLVVVYLVRIDWQPQGRYLFPALPALAGLAAPGLRRIADDPRWPRFLMLGLLPLLLASALGLALLGISAILRAYA
jgi:hypothetical protein